MNGATEIGSGSFAIPFFDGDPKYLIRTVLWTGSTQVGTGVYGTGQIIIEPAGISFSGVGIS